MTGQHRPWQGEDAPERCFVCDKPWPCPDRLFMDRQTEAADAIHAALVLMRGCWHVHPTTLAPLPEGEWACRDFLARLTGMGFTVEPIPERDAEAIIEQARAALDSLEAAIDDCTPEGITAAQTLRDILGDEEDEMAILRDAALSRGQP